MSALLVAIPYEARRTAMIRERIQRDRFPSLMWHEIQPCRLKVASFAHGGKSPTISSTATDIAPTLHFFLLLTLHSRKTDSNKATAERWTGLT